MNTPRTDIRVRLVGEDGNIFFILGRVREALRRGGRPDLMPEVTVAVTSSHSYEEALAMVMEYVELLMCLLSSISRLISRSDNPLHAVLPGLLTQALKWRHT